MNLIRSRWVPTATGAATPDEALRANALSWPRQDFDAACVMLLAGLLQTAIVKNPLLCQDEDDWEDWRDAPPDTLRDWITPIAEAFNLFGTRAFLQELAALPDGKVIPVGALLPESPGENTLVTKMSDIGRWAADVPKHFSLPVAAMALYADNQFGIRIGAGHRQGTVGENRLFTLIEPDGQATVWQRVWLNVLPYERWAARYGEQDWDDNGVFPWLSPTRTSEKKSTTLITTPAEAHPLQAYWQMPRRVRLPEPTEGVCDISGQAGPVIATYLRQNSGINYDGWTHPFVPYAHDKEGKPIPLSMGSSHIGYSQWAGIAHLGYRSVTPAVVVNEFIERRMGSAEVLRLRCFGWHLVSGDAASWTDATVPLVLAKDRVAFGGMVEKMLSAAGEANGGLRRATGKLGLSPSDMLYDRTENQFYDLLREHVTTADSDAPAGWVDTVRRAALGVFDELSERVQRDPLKVAKARATLLKQLPREVKEAA